MIEEKKIGGFSLFALWFGAAISLAEIMTGSLLAPLGMKKGIIAILLGHLIGTLILTAVGVIGFREKRPSLISSRIALGRYGSYLISVFNILQLVGWTAIMLIQSARSLQPITEGLLGIDNFAVLVITVGVLVAVWALNVDKGASFLNNVAVALLAILSIGMMAAVAEGGEAQQFTETISFGVALELSIVMPLSWVPLIADYTRLGKSLRGSVFGSFWGYFLGSCLMYMIGLTSAVYTGNSDPVDVMIQLNMGLSALLIVLLATVTTTFLDVYSTVMSTLNLVPRMSKRTLIIVFSALGTLIALYFPMEQYENFLYLIGSLFAPVFSIIIINYFYYKKDRSLDLINIPAIVSAALGTGAYYIVSRYDLILGSTIPAMIITVIFYSAISYISEKIKSDAST